MYCTTCGKKIRDGANYCVQCGSPVPDYQATHPRSSTDPISNVASKVHFESTELATKNFFLAGAAMNILAYILFSLAGQRETFFLISGYFNLTVLGIIAAATLIILLPQIDFGSLVSIGVAHLLLFGVISILSLIYLLLFDAIDLIRFLVGCPILGYIFAFGYNFLTLNQAKGENKQVFFLKCLAHGLLDD
jgi:zinc-ribbon domain